MARPETFDLRSRTVGALPIVQHFLSRLRLESLLERHVPTRDRRLRLRHATALGVLLKNILVGRRPLYGMQEWARPHVPGLLGLEEDQERLLNDDRVGRALDRLFDADRASLMTEVVVRAISEFRVDLDQLHNDSTSITFSGQHAGATGRPLRGKKTAQIGYGHNKDHRPDLKQLLWILTVSADGAVPIHYRVCDGKTPDDPTHIETWEALRKLAGRPDFLYVADCKLCTRANMGHIAREGGRFITVLPRSRREDAWFRNHVQNHRLDWEEVVRRPNPRRRDGMEDLWRAVESPMRSAEGHRIVWVWSQLMAERDQQARLASIQRALEGVEELDRKLQGKRTRYRDRAAVEEAVENVIKTARAERWASATITEENVPRFTQEGPGRPGANTRYVRQDRTRFRVTWKPLADIIAFDANSDGMFPLITNCDDLPLGDVLAKYKYQPTLEKRHEQLKTVYAVAPAFLQNVGRIEALLLLYFIALLVQALIERQVRLGMDAEKIDMLPLYPEERDCRAPTANRILEVFDALQQSELLQDGTIRQRFEPILNPLQLQILRLLQVSDRTFASN